MNVDHSAQVAAADHQYPKHICVPFDVKGFDPDEPRDETGKWTDGGGSDSGAPKPSGGGAKPEAAGSWKEPSREQLENWTKQINDRQYELEQHGQLGSHEDDALQQMSGAIGHYWRAHHGDQQGKQQVYWNSVHDADKLHAAVSTVYNPKTNVAEISFSGGLDREALATALRGAQQQGEELGALRVEGNTFLDDPDKVGAYEDAGFRKISEGHGVGTFIWGAPTTEGERRDAAERDAAHIKQVRDTADSVAKDLGFDQYRIRMGDEKDPERDFTLNGKQYKAAGLAYTRSNNPNLKGTIKLFPTALYGEAAMQGVAAHEIEHIKYQQVLDRHQQERELALNDPGPPPKPDSEHRWERLGGKDAVMRADGTLFPPYDQKYPVYHAMTQALDNPGWEQFQKGDGVTSYSKEYWQQFEKDKTAENYRKASHETLAEMASVKYTNKKFPDHEGTSPSNKANNAKIWRNLYRTVDKLYTLPPRSVMSHDHPNQSQ